VVADPHTEIESSLCQLETLRKALRKGTSQQVSASADKDIIRAVALGWLKGTRSNLDGLIASDDLTELDSLYTNLLSGTTTRRSRKAYLASISEIRRRLRKLHPVAVLATAPTPSDDTPPKFSSLVADAKMQAILLNRWDETVKCINAGAELAATVMMGGLLEALILARVNQLPDKGPVFTAKAIPKDRAGKPRPQKEWTLQAYIDIAHELGWIGQSAKDISVVLRDYRNYIHPQKELSHGVVLTQADAEMLWPIAKNIVRQILK